MRIAIISDIHGNLEALEKALLLISTKNIDEIVCLGDIVGYGPNPNECLQLVYSHTSNVVLGNHDEAAIDLKAAEYFNPYAHLAAEWTNKQLTEENKAILQRTPYIMELHDLLFVHASPYQPEWWYYIMSWENAQLNFQHFKQQVCFVGHSHIPGVFCQGEKMKEVKRQKRYIINVGSIGQPRDHDPRLSFGIFDSETWEYENVRAWYDIKKTADKIYHAGLPPILGDRLFDGK